MKIIVLVAAVLALGFAFELNNKDGLVHFEQDTNKDSPVGIVMKGHVDPKNEMNNKIGAFLKLASYYVPLLESVNQKEATNLGWTKDFRVHVGNLIDITVTGEFMVCAGWKVYLNSNALNQTSDHLEATYAPYVWGWANGFVQGTTYPANGYYNATLYFVRTYASIGLKIYDNGQICFGGSGHFWPVQLESSLSAAYKQCAAEIFTDVINGNPITLGCTLSPACNMTHLNISFTQNYTQTVIDDKCISI